MATTEEELKSFSQFVREHAEGDADSRLRELFDLWMRFF